MSQCEKIMNNESPEIRSEICWVLNYPSRSGHHLLASCQERKIKVNKTQYMRKLKDDPVGAGRQVPWIQLKGYWLKQVGFEINAPVKSQSDERLFGVDDNGRV
jgi:hypothetical protein